MTCNANIIVRASNMILAVGHLQRVSKLLLKLINMGRKDPELKIREVADVDIMSFSPDSTKP
jgi:hypothetical protein